ncbi:hypothetical protein Tco_1553040, partial [Tanacetum coccineum]
RKALDDDDVDVLDVLSLELRANQVQGKKVKQLVMVKI